MNRESVVIKPDLIERHPGRIERHPGPLEAAPVESALRAVEEEARRAVGEPFLRALARHLARAAGARWAFISEVVRPGQARLLVLWTGDGYESGPRYALGGTSWDALFVQATDRPLVGSVGSFPEGHWLRDVGAGEYATIPLFTVGGGEPLGQLGILDGELRDVEPICALLRAFADRAAPELQRVVTERKLRDSEEQFRRLVEASPDIIFRRRVWPDRAFEYINLAFERLSGHSREELYRDPDFFLRLIDPAELEDLREVHEGRRTPQSAVRHWILEDGSERWTEQHNLPVYDQDGRLVAVEGVARDVTEHVLARRAQEERAQLQRAFLEAIPDLLFVMAPDGSNLRVLAQRDVERFGLGVSSENRLQEMVPTAARAVCRSALNQLKRLGGVQSFRYTTGKSADESTFEVRLAPSGESLVAGIVRDVTAGEWMQAEKSSREEREQLEGRVQDQIARFNPFGLTFREFTVLHLIAQGYADKEIAQRLHISHFTVNKYVGTILIKMDARSRTEAATRAIKEGLVVP